LPCQDHSKPYLVQINLWPVISRFLPQMYIELDQEYLPMQHLEMMETFTW